MKISFVGSSKTHLMQCSGIDTLWNLAWGVNLGQIEPVKLLSADVVGFLCTGSFFVYNFSVMTPDNGDMGVTLIPLSLGCPINPSDYVSTVL
jgi:hypothetical protein